MMQTFKNKTVYQIYPKSFFDTTGNGIGDIQGIKAKLPYLQTLGVDILWLTPIYVSPQRDNGYDIADYKQIDPLFGTMADFEALLNDVNARGMQLIMDMVVNHTSTDHAWFQDALAKGPESPYYDFYIWRDSVNGAAPTNWQSKFGGSAWEYVPHLQQYYLHLFDVTQADLNWENPKLRAAIYEMMRFWMEKGIAGFRLDVVNLLSKDQAFPNDTLATPMADGRKFYTDGPRIHEHLQEMHTEVFAHYPDAFTVGEMSSTTIEHCQRYTNPDNHELLMTFNFHHLKVDYPNGEKWAIAPFDFQQLKKLFYDWQLGMQAGNGWNALFWCNHDQPRAISRFGDDQKYPYESATMLALAIHGMQGTPYIYQGEELGMTNAYYTSIDQYRDVEALNAYQNLQQKGYTSEEALAILQVKSRDNSRTPMQWNTTKNAGFTSGTPWIPVIANYETINAETVLQQPQSIFSFYQQLLQLRKQSQAISEGSFQAVVADHPTVYGYIRATPTEKLVVLCNFYGQESDVILPDFEIGEVIVNNYVEFEHTRQACKLQPYQAVLIRVNEAV